MHFIHIYLPWPDFFRLQVIFILLDIYNGTLWFLNRITSGLVSLTFHFSKTLSSVSLHNLVFAVKLVQNKWLTIPLHGSVKRDLFVIIIFIITIVFVEFILKCEFSVDVCSCLFCRKSMITTLVEKLFSPFCFESRARADVVFSSLFKTCP